MPSLRRGSIALVLLALAARHVAGSRHAAAAGHARRGLVGNVVCGALGLPACPDYSTDVSNCGIVGNKCTVANGVPKCTAGKCTIASCNPGYTQTSTECVLNASPKSRAKREARRSKMKSLCPEDETACPIVGSSSFFKARSNNFLAFRDQDEEGIASTGYECLETAFAVDSCGGCVSMGEGTNCLAIPHTSSVGCDNGACIVFSCTRGYKPNMASTGCVKAVSPSNAHRNRHRGERFKH